MDGGRGGQHVDKRKDIIRVTDEEFKIRELPTDYTYIHTYIHTYI